MFKDNEILKLKEMGYDDFSIEVMMSDNYGGPWSFDEAKMVAEKWGVENVIVCLDSWNKETIIKGYAVFDDYNIEGTTVIQRIDELDGFDGDEHAAVKAEEDGVAIAWDLIDTLDKMGLSTEMYIDTEENRKIIGDYIIKQKGYNRGSMEPLYWLQDVFGVGSSPKKYTVKELKDYVEWQIKREEMGEGAEEILELKRKREKGYRLTDVGDDIENLSKWLRYFGYIVHESIEKVQEVTEEDGEKYGDFPLDRKIEDALDYQSEKESVSETAEQNLSNINKNFERYEIEIEIRDSLDYEYSLSVTGSDLENVKNKAFKDIMIVCQENNIEGEVYIDMMITENGQYYDHDEAFALIDLDEGTIQVDFEELPRIASLLNKALDYQAEKGFDSKTENEIFENIIKSLSGNER